MRKLDKKNQIETNEASKEDKRLKREKEGGSEVNFNHSV